MYPASDDSAERAYPVELSRAPGRIAHWNLADVVQFFGKRFERYELQPNGGAHRVVHRR